MSFSQQQVLALAPDAASAAAGKKLARPGDWKNLGQNDSALWGQCQGSALYQVQVDRSDLSGKCSCPSRKFPCKHVLGLLLLAADGGAAVPAGAATPDFVQEWLEKRQGAAVKKAQKAEAPPAEVDLVAQEKRAAERRRRVAAGLDAFELWLADLMRQGLASLTQEGATPWRHQAARLIDAQAPALAGRVARLAELPASGTDWAPALLAELGKIGLLLEAHRRLESLPEDLAADVRHTIGWTTSTEDVLSRGEKLSDRWLVTARQVDEDEKLRVRRYWLHGLESGRSALILQFSVAGQPFSSGKEVGGSLFPGMVVDAELAFFPSAWPQRALFREQRGSGPAQENLPGRLTFAELFGDLAAALARQPFLDRFPALLPAVVPVMQAGELRLVDGEGRAVPAWAADPWRLVASAGGRPLGIAGEWSGRRLLCLSVQRGQRLEPLSLENET